MPSSDSYGKRPLVAVKPVVGATWKYGYKSNISESEKTDLGVINGIDANGGYISGLLIGVNRPKPAKARKLSPTLGYDGSYVSYDRINAAIAAGYKITKAKTRYAKPSLPNSVAVYITIAPLDEAGQPSGISYKYAWNMRKELHTKINADLPGLGIIPCDGTESDLVWGVDEYFLPRTAKKLITNADASSSVLSTFVDPSKYDSLPTGWSL